MTKNNMNNKIIIVVALVLIAGAFYGGMKYSQSQAAAAQAARVASFGGGAGARGGTRLAGGAAGGVSGDIVSKDATSVTVSMKAGGSKVVLISPSTTVMKTVNGTLSDLSIGKTVTIIGTANSDGSVTATAVQIRQATTTGQ